jgi:hypothetical protein
MIHKTSGIIKLGGRFLVAAWKPGLIGGLLGGGMDLKTAMQVARDRGGLEWKNAVENMIVDAGLALTAKWGINEDSTGLTWHAIGTGSAAPAAGNTALGTESKRLAFTSRERSGALLSLTAFYLASESTFHIRELGVFGGAAAGSTPGSGTLFSRALYDVDNSGGTNDLTFTYELTNARG